MFMKAHNLTSRSKWSPRAINVCESLRCLQSQCPSDAKNVQDHISVDMS